MKRTAILLSGLALAALVVLSVNSVAAAVKVTAPSTGACRPPANCLPAIPPVVPPPACRPPADCMPAIPPVVVPPAVVCRPPADCMPAIPPVVSPPTPITGCERINDKLICF
jgi:hypothetical protein